MERIFKKLNFLQSKNFSIGTLIEELNPVVRDKDDFEGPENSKAKNYLGN